MKKITHFLTRVRRGLLPKTQEIYQNEAGECVEETNISLRIHILGHAFTWKLHQTIIRRNQTVYHQAEGVTDPGWMTKAGILISRPEMRHPRIHVGQH